MSLKDRILKPTRSATSTVTRSTSYKSWSEEKMQLAYEAVLESGLSVRHAAEEYGIPKSTLADRVSGRRLMGCRSGPPRLLSDAQEECLVKFLLRCATIGYAKSKKDVIAIIMEMCKSKRLDHKVTDGWWNSFLKRHPNLTLRSASCLSKARAIASDPSSIQQYFDILEETLDEYDIKDSPNFIYNMDETGMPFQPKLPKGIFARGEQNPSMLSSGNKGQLTVVACTNTAGFCIPPMVIIDRKNLSQPFCDGEVPGTIYALSSSGWMNMELFHLWFSQHFFKYIPSCRPILLLIDGHKSHYNPDTIRLAAKEQVILFTLPPNTTHLCQPLDRSCFGPLKVAWREASHQFMSDNPGKVISRYSFSKIFNQAWMKAMTSQNIVSGFRVTGICPFDHTVLLPDDDEESSKELTYLPLLTPKKGKRSSYVSLELRKISSSFSKDTDESDGISEDDANLSVQSLSEDEVLMLPRQDSLESILKPPIPLNKASQTGSQAQSKSVRVLTSKENLKALQQREKEKADIEQKKVERKAAQELKKKKKELSKKTSKSNLEATGTIILLDCCIFHF